MTQTISAIMMDKHRLDEAIQFLVTEYGMQDGDIRVRHGREDDDPAGTTFSVEVNDDEVDEISDALVAIAAVMDDVSGGSSQDR